jgi:glycosyltransferase involved in cell wall biosynthesis
MAALDVLILTSSRDSMPGVVVEAQLAGCPVVSYPVDGIEMALAPGRSGVVTAGADPEEMAKRVEEILGDPTRHDEMVAAARAHARGLSTEQLAPRYAHLLSMVAGTIRTGSPRPLRVLHVLPDLGVGGAERALEVLAAHVDAAQVVQAVVVVGGARRPLPETVHDGLQKLGVPYCDLGVTRRPSRSVLGLVLAATRLGRVARRFGADVVDAALFDAALPARLARGSWATVTHLVNTPYEPTVLQAVGARRWRAALLRRIDQWSARRDDALVALTEAVAETARHHLALEEGDPRLLVIPRGVDLDRFSPIPLPSDAGGTLTITTVGRLVPQKGHDVLIRAVARARAAGTPLRLRIAGEGPLAEALAELVRSLDLAEMVEVISPTLEVPSLLHASHIFALASRWEGQSNAVLEAMACGLPILVSDLAVLREVVGDAGRFVPADDVEAWAAALAELAPDADERRRLGAAARSRVEQRYGAPARSAELACLYRRVAART